MPAGRVSCAHRRSAADPQAGRARSRSCALPECAAVPQKKETACGRNGGFGGLSQHWAWRWPPAPCAPAAISMSTMRARSIPAAASTRPGPAAPAPTPAARAAPGPACRVGPFEVGLNIDRLAVPGAPDAVVLGPQLKWTVLGRRRQHLERRAVGHGQLRGARSGGRTGGQFLLPLTWHPQPACGCTATTAPTGPSAAATRARAAASASSGPSRQSCR